MLNPAPHLDMQYTVFGCCSLATCHTLACQRGCSHTSCTCAGQGGGERAGDARAHGGGGHSEGRDVCDAQDACPDPQHVRAPRYFQMPAPSQLRHARCRYVYSHSRAAAGGEVRKLGCEAELEDLRHRFLSQAAHLERLRSAQLP